MSGAGRIVILNGAGSVGKSSIARHLQQISNTPFLHLQMDVFLDMMPGQLFNHDDGIRFLPARPGGVKITTGSVAQRVLDGMLGAIAAIARDGNDLIVDDVIYDGRADDYSKALSEFKTYWVGITAPLDVIEAREQARGDRAAGLARWQYDRVHDNIAYDLVVDAGSQSINECADIIKQRFGL